MESRKSHCSVTVIGAEASGKSRLVAHLVWNCGGIDKKAIEKYEKDVDAYQKGHFRYYPMSLSSPAFELYLAGRNKLTLDISVDRMELSGRVISLIDTPGIPNLLKNAATGISLADIAILMIAPDPSPKEPIDKAISEYVLYAYAFGVKKLIVCINKMDDPKISWSQKIYEHASKQVSDLLTQVGYNPSNIPLIPISAVEGHNIREKRGDVLWYNGPTLLEALESVIEFDRKKLEELPLRITVSHAFKIGGIGTVAVGKIATGVLELGKTISCAPGDFCVDVKSIEMHHEQVDRAGPGDLVGIHFKGILVRDFHRGCVFGNDRNGKLREAVRFLAQVVIIKHSTEIKEGYTLVLDCHTAHVPCRFSKIKCIVNKKTGEVIEEDPKSVKAGDSCLVVLTPLKSVYVETFAEYPQLGRFVLRDSNCVIGAGIVKSVEKT